MVRRAVTLSACIPPLVNDAYGDDADDGKCERRRIIHQISTFKVRFPCCGGDAVVADIVLHCG